MRSYCEGLLVLSAATSASACLSGVAVRPTPLVEVSFGAGGHLGGPAEDPRGSLVFASAALGGIGWQEQGDEPVLRRVRGLGGAASLTWFDKARKDLGLDLILAPPRFGRESGFQLRIGARVATDGEHAGPTFSAEWSDAWLGGLFAEAQYDFMDSETTLLVGARVNLLFPVTYVRASAGPIEE